VSLSGDSLERAALVHSDVIGRVALNLVLWFSPGGVVRVSFVVNILRVHLEDPPAHASRLGIPGHVVADPESFLHP